MTKSSDERTCETGLYEKSGVIIKNGKAYLIMGAFFMALELFIIYNILSSETFIDGKTMVFVIESNVLFLYLVAMFLVSFPLFFVLIGASSLYHGYRSKNAKYTSGERHAVWLVPVKGGTYIGEIGNFCPKCEADLGSLVSDYCWKCGCKLDF